MDLGETGIGEKRAFFVSAIGRGHVAAARVGRKIKNVSVTAGRENNRIASEHFDLSGAQIASDDSFGVTIDNHEIEHFGLRKHLHRAGGDLAAKRLITTEQQLLAGLTARVKRSRDLRAAE